MIGTDCTPGLLAEPAEKPNVRSLGIPAPPNGRWVSSCTKRYTTSDVITSFFEDETSDEPWLVIVEPY